MIAFMGVLRNDLYRLWEEKARIVLMLVLVAGAIVIAIFISSRSEMAGNIALVSNDSDVSISSEYLNITVLDEAPPMSELVSNKYDAIVTSTDDYYDIQTIKSDSFRETLETILSDPSVYHGDTLGTRQIGTNIIGFLIMFVLMQGVYLMFLFAEDKERKQIVRIAASPVSFTGYLCAHSIFSFLFLLVPTILILYIVKGIMGVDIGFSFPQYLMLIALMCAIATTFSLFLNAMAKKGDTANMLGSALVVMTSILSGSFYSFEKYNDVLETVIKILPQKSYLTIVSSLEGGTAISEILPHLIYVLALIAIFFIIAVIKTRREYVRSN